MENTEDRIEALRSMLKEKSQLYTTYSVKNKQGKFRQVIDIDTVIEIILEITPNSIQKGG